MQKKLETKTKTELNSELERRFFLPLNQINIGSL